MQEAVEANSKANSEAENTTTTTVNIREIKINENYKNLIPELSSEDYQALREDILKKGVLDTLKVNADLILLDGHTRYQIAKELNIAELPVKFFKFDSIWDEKEFIIAINRNRRHFNKAQLAELALKLAEIEREKAKERQKKLGADFGQLGGRGIKKGSEEYNKKANHFDIESKKTLRSDLSEGVFNMQNSSDHQDYQTDIEETGKALEIAAQKIKVGYGSVFKAHKIKEEAEKNPEIAKAWEEAKNEKKSIDSVYKSLQKKEQIEKAKKAYVNSTKTAVGDDPPILYHQDAVELLASLENDSIDLLLTDPPYSTDIENISAFAKSWLPLALQKLKPTGRAYIFVGAYPHELKAYIDILLSQEKFVLDNPLIWTYKNTLGQTPKMKYNLNYQVILHLYSNKSKPLNTDITKEMFSVMEFNAPDGRQGKRLHSWEKPLDLAKMLIRHSTVENEVVVDCFAGTGTFVLAAKQMNRQAYGCDINIENLNIAKERGCKIRKTRT